MSFGLICVSGPCSGPGPRKHHKSVTVRPHLSVTKTILSSVHTRLYERIIIVIIVQNLVFAKWKKRQFVLSSTSMPHRRFSEARCRASRQHFRTSPDYQFLGKRQELWKTLYCKIHFDSSYGLCSKLQ